MLLQLYTTTLQIGTFGRRMNYYNSSFASRSASFASGVYDINSIFCRDAYFADAVQNTSARDPIAATAQTFNMINVRVQLSCQ